MPYQNTWWETLKQLWYYLRYGDAGPPEKK